MKKQYLGSATPQPQIQTITMKVTIKKWNAVATWRWDIPEDDVCGICQVHFDGTCPACKYPGDECRLCKSASISCTSLAVLSRTHKLMVATSIWKVWPQLPYGTYSLRSPASGEVYLITNVLALHFRMDQARIRQRAMPHV